jgi:hypothetical protein
MTWRDAARLVPDRSIEERGLPDGRFRVHWLGRRTGSR